MQNLIDWLGKDFRVRKTDVEDQIEITLNCNQEAIFYWTLQYGPCVEVLEPATLRDRIGLAAKELNEKYNGGMMR